MMRRRLGMALHWTTAASLLFLLAAGADSVFWGWVFGVSALGFAVLALIGGLMTRPGPKLPAPLRVALPWAHRVLYLGLAWAALAVLATLHGMVLPGPAPRVLLIALLGAGLFHAGVNFWRHTTLQDGALRRMTPAALHNLL